MNSYLGVTDTYIPNFPPALFALLTRTQFEPAYAVRQVLYVDADHGGSVLSTTVWDDRGGLLATSLVTFPSDGPSPTLPEILAEVVYILTYGSPGLMSWGRARRPINRYVTVTPAPALTRKETHAANTDVRADAAVTRTLGDAGLRVADASVAAVVTGSGGFMPDVRSNE